MQTHPHNTRPGSFQIFKPLHELYSPDDGEICEPQHDVGLGKTPVATDELRRRRAQLERRAKRNLRPTAFHEAAHAVVAHRFGYHVDRITIHPVTDVFDAVTGNVANRVGFTYLTGLPTVEELPWPERRSEAERYIIMRLIGPFAEAFARGRRNRWGKSDDLEVVLPLIEHHAEWCQDRYFAWLKERTELTFFGPALTDILAVARKLVRQREMTGTEFGQFLRRRTRDERKRASEMEAYLTARDGR